MSHPASDVYIGDSYALLAFLNGESSAPRVQAVLRLAQQHHVRMYLPVINLGEVLYITERERGLQMAQRTVAAIEQLPIDILDATRERVLAAAHIKAQYRVSYADAFAVAAAAEFDGTVLTGDPEFASVQHLIRIEWL